MYYVSIFPQALLKLFEKINQDLHVDNTAHAFTRPPALAMGLGSLLINVPPLDWYPTTLKPWRSYRMVPSLEASTQPATARTSARSVPHCSIISPAPCRRKSESVNKICRSTCNSQCLTQELRDRPGKPLTNISLGVSLDPRLSHLSQDTQRLDAALIVQPRRRRVLVGPNRRRSTGEYPPVTGGCYPARGVVDDLDPQCVRVGAHLLLVARHRPRQVVLGRAAHQEVPDYLRERQPAEPDHLRHVGLGGAREGEGRLARHGRCAGDLRVRGRCRVDGLVAGFGQLVGDDVFNICGRGRFRCAWI